MPTNNTTAVSKARIKDPYLTLFLLSFLDTPYTEKEKAKTSISTMYMGIRLPANIPYCPL